MKSADSVTVVVVHYGDYALTRKCVLSILKSDTDVHIVVSDNSNQADYTQLKQDFEDCVLIKNPDESVTYTSAKLVWMLNHRNIGYAAAANAGLRLAKQLRNDSYYLILNNDCTLTPHTISTLLQVYEQTPNCGLLGAKVLFARDEAVINSVGGYFNPYTAWQKNIGARQNDTGQFKGLLKPDYIYGACMFFSSAFLDKVGYMDDSFLLYYEEHDWCIRSRKCGYENYTCTDAVVYHQQGASSGKKIKSTEAPDHILILQYGNLIRFYFKHYPWLTPVAYIKLMAQAIKRLLRGQFQHTVLILKVIFGKRIYSLPS